MRGAFCCEILSSTALYSIGLTFILRTSKVYVDMVNNSWPTTDGQDVWIGTHPLPQ